VGALGPWRAAADPVLGPLTAPQIGLLPFRAVYLLVLRRLGPGHRLALATAVLALPVSLEAEVTGAWRDPAETPTIRTVTRPPLRGPLDAGGLGEVIDSTATPPRLGQDALDLQTRSNVVQGAGARAHGMGGAFLARPDDATAASWNPAGLSYLRFPEFSLVGAANSLDVTTRAASGELLTDDKRSGRTPDFIAGAWPVQIRGVTGAAQLSFQRVVSFQADRTIEGSSLRTLSSSGGFDVLALGTGLQVSHRLRLGFTVNRWFNGYDQYLERTQTLRPTLQSIEFSFSGWNLNVGGIWSPLDDLNLGAVFKSPFTADVRMERGRTDFALDGAITSNSASRSDLELDFPGAFGVGASWRPISTLTVSMDCTLTNWSTGKVRNYFTLPPTGTPQAPADFFAVLPYPSLILNGSQKNTEQIRIGSEYVAIRSRVKVPLRAGAFLDRQLFTDPYGQRPTFRGLTAGTGLIVGRWLVDVAYLYEWGSYDERPPAEATDRRVLGNSLRSHRFFLSFIYRHRP
jgi:hypothetical protein